MAASAIGNRFRAHFGFGNVSMLEQWQCAQHRMRTVRRRIYAAHLTVCRGIIEQLEQVESDAFPTAFVTGNGEWRDPKGGFPTPMMVARAEFSELKDVGLSTRKAEYRTFYSSYYQWESHRSC
jgi:hypothetical protein